MALTPEQIAGLREATAAIAAPINEWLLQDAAQRIAMAGKMTSTAAYELYRAKAMGESERALKRYLKQQLKLSNKEIRRLFQQAARFSRDNDMEKAGLGGFDFQDARLDRMALAAVALAQKDFTNLTQTLGMVTPGGQVQPLRKFYRQTMDFAFQQIFTGAADYNTAIKLATTKMTDAGVRVIDYESGVHTGIEAAVRRNMMGGLGLMDEQITKADHDEFGCNGWEISAHANSAPDHEPYQGRQYSDEDYTALNGRLKRRIGTLNCGHVAFPIILGVSSPQYTEQQLQAFKDDNAAGVSYAGRHYTGYEATQKQRQIERTIRRQKNRILVAEQAGDEGSLLAARVRLTRLRQEYRAFSKATGLPTQEERLWVSGFGRKRTTSGPKRNKLADLRIQKPPKRKKSEAAGLKREKGKSVENSTLHRATEKLSLNTGNTGHPNGIINSDKKISEGLPVQIIGNIDTGIFQVVSDKIKTDEVVISSERIQHIKDHHPNDFEKYSQYIAEMLKCPQYILDDPVPNTAVILNEFAEAGEHFRLILKLAVIGDEDYKKNSVITFLKISEKKFKKYVRNKKILYKSE